MPNFSERLFKVRNSLLPLIAFHIIFFSSFFLILSFLGFIKGYPSNTNLIDWDAAWYKNIVDNGYSYTPDEPSNVNFFPLFPLVWRLLTLSPIWISALNLSLLFAGLSLLRKTYHFNKGEFLLLLSVPSLFFCYVPYSEAFFFVTASMLLYGYKKDFRLVLLGLFLMGLTRSISIITLPILVFVFLIQLRQKKEVKLVLLKLVASLVVTIVSLFVAQYLQYLESDNFFTLFTSQKAFDRSLRLPEFYLTTWDGARLIWLDGLAFLTGISAVLFCAYLLLRRTSRANANVSSSSLFSYAYLGFTTLVVLFYSAVDGAGGTSLMSLNRYIFCTPFFMVFLLTILRHFRPNAKSIILFAALSMATWLLFNVQGYLPGLDNFLLPFFKTKLYFLLITLYALAHLLSARKAYQASILSGLYVFNLLLQIFLFSQFIQWIWIG